MLEINIPEVVAEVTEAFMRYERALIANDVSELDALFWDSPHTLRFGIGENLYGHGAIASFRSGRPAIDLTRRLMNTVITTFGRDPGLFNAPYSSSYRLGLRGPRVRRRSDPGEWYRID
jgi:hypothetical protein